jgi:multidrug efflux pump
MRLAEISTLATACTLPLALTHGAGAAAQNAIGTAVTGGLLSATFIDLIFIPFFFVLISRLFAKKPPRGSVPEPAGLAHSSATG